MKTRALIVLAIVVAVASAGLLWLLIAFPALSAPVEAVAVVLGTGFTAFAAYSALRAAQASRAASADTLRRERGTLQAERSRLDAERGKLAYWLDVATQYRDNLRADAIAADIATTEARSVEVDARLAEIRAELGE